MPARANGQLALGVYRIDPETGDYVPIALDVLTLRGELIADGDGVPRPLVFARFGLPVRLATGGGGTDSSPA